MKSVYLFLTAIAIVFSCETFAQDINAIFNNKLTIDAHLSNQTKAMKGLLSSYGEVQTKIYSYKGTFEEAVNNMKPPYNADVGEVTDQPLSNNFNMFFMMTDNFDPKPMSEAWYENARKKSVELESKMGKSLSITIQGQMDSEPRVGDKIEIRMIAVLSPYLDLDNLKVIDGTWVTESIVANVITQEMLEDNSDDFDNAWEDKEMDMGVNLPSKAHFVNVEDVADSEYLQGDANYIVELPTKEVIDFYKKNTNLFVNGFEQSEMVTDDDKTNVITYFNLLKHQGEIESGDDVVAITIQSAPKSVLSDALGRNQGTWTLLSISRWTE